MLVQNRCRLERFITPATRAKCRPSRACLWRRSYLRLLLLSFWWASFTGESGKPHPINNDATTTNKTPWLLFSIKWCECEGAWLQDLTLILWPWFWPWFSDFLTLIFVSGNLLFQTKVNQKFTALCFNFTCLFLGNDFVWLFLFYPNSPIDLTNFVFNLIFSICFCHKCDRHKRNITFKVKFSRRWLVAPE